jgi:hypothetical protein
MDISMPTPRPPGVRCADVNEEQFVLAHNTLPKLVVYSWGSSGFAARFSRSASAKLRRAHARRNFLGSNRYMKLG